MAFQIKSFVSIVASMVNYARTTTQKWSDYNRGSKVRTILECSALEIEELYQQMVNGLVEAIPTSVYLTFSFGLLPAKATSFPVQVNFSANNADQTISAGTVLTRSDQAVSYTVAADTAVPANSITASVLVVATVDGVSGNCPPNTTFTMSPTPAAFSSAVALSGGNNGSDLETEAGRFARFTAYIQTLTRGTVPALNYVLSTAALYDASGGIIEQVKLKLVVEPYVTDNTQPVGLVNCYIHNGVGNTSAALVTQALQVVNGYYDASGNGIPGYKAAGVQVTVAAASEQSEVVTGVIEIDAHTDGPTAVAAAVALLQAYMLGLPIGAPYIAAKATALVMSVPGVTDWLPAAPMADIATSGINYKIMPGVITLTPIAPVGALSIGGSGI